MTLPPEILVELAQVSKPETYEAITAAIKEHTDKLSALSETNKLLDEQLLAATNNYNAANAKIASLVSNSLAFNKEPQTKVDSKGLSKAINAEFSKLFGGET